MKNFDRGLENAFSSPRSQFFTIRTDPKSANNTQIANMATMSPKRVFSVVTIAKGCPALFFQEFCSLSLRNWMVKSKGRPVQGQISSKCCKIHLKTGVVKASVFIKATFAFSLLCRFERR